jgi:hypothetical protein
MVADDPCRSLFLAKVFASTLRGMMLSTGPSLVLRITILTVGLTGSGIGGSLAPVAPVCAIRQRLQYRVAELRLAPSRRPPRVFVTVQMLDVKFITD